MQSKLSLAAVGMALSAYAVNLQENCACNSCPCGGNDVDIKINFNVEIGPDDGDADADAEGGDAEAKDCPDATADMDDMDGDMDGDMDDQDNMDDMDGDMDNMDDMDDMDDMDNMDDMDMDMDDMDMMVDCAPLTDSWGTCNADLLTAMEHTDLEAANETRVMEIFDAGDSTQAVLAADAAGLMTSLLNDMEWDINEEVATWAVVTTADLTGCEASQTLIDGCEAEYPALQEEEANNLAAIASA